MRHNLTRAALPVRLAEIADPPDVLHVEGDVAVLHGESVAIVGSRRCSTFGRRFAETLAGDLAALRLTIVSGLAHGIDAAAHRGALDAGGDTVAVLGSGLDRIYPASHRALAREIVDAGGALVSEYADDVGPRKHHFPQRNRLISGLCSGVLIVEATERSGSLITARMALEQGRDVMAVPGYPRSPASAGCHRLLRQGAALVETASDVAEVLGLEFERVPRARLAPSESAPSELVPVLEATSAVATTVDEISAVTGITPAAVIAALTLLEVEGFVEAQLHGYIRRPS